MAMFLRASSGVACMAGRKSKEMGANCEVSVGCPCKPDQGEMGVKKEHPTVEDLKGHACECPDNTA